MKWTEDHDLTLCGEVLLQEPFKHPKNSKERGEVWGQIALNLHNFASPIFKVSKRSVRNRLTLLQTKYKEKTREEKRASGIDCEETQLDAAVEEILDKEKAADMERNEQAGTLTKKYQSEKRLDAKLWNVWAKSKNEMQIPKEKENPVKEGREQVLMLLNTSRRRLS